MSSIEDNKAIVRHYRQELMNEGHWSVVDEIFPEKFILNGQEMSPENFKPFAAMWRTAFPDLVYTLDHLIAEGEWVVEHWIARGTHRGSLFGIAPTGKSFESMGINIHRVVDGKIVEIWEVADALGELQQLGILPSWEKLAAQG
jgi:predicted ester cyclase